MSATVMMALIGAVFTAVIVALDLPSVVKNSSGAPGWMYAVDFGLWFVVVYWGRIVWGLSPKQLLCGMLCPSGACPAPISFQRYVNS